MKLENGAAIRERLILHGLRRTGIRNLVTLPSLRGLRVLRHKTHALFQGYNVVDVLDLKDAVGKLDSHMVAKQNDTKQKQAIN